MLKIKERWPRIALAIYLLVFVFFAYKPANFGLWLTENTIAVGTVAVLFYCYRRGIRFSNLSYTLMLIALCWQTIGGHYCFSYVPFGFITDLFGFERNNYDRIGHVMVGFFVLPVMEYFESRDLVRGRGLNALLVILAIFGIAGAFEIIEWSYADLMTRIRRLDIGNEFLGSQGDIWDAQKDILCDGIGAILTAILYCIRYRGKDVKKFLEGKE
ncbi:MAG: DUF2238 domain-containing protein [Lentisphaerae bacterium]|nr:DUF2238 domain-containing protein [Lentisphaerota bacterium]